MADIVEAGLAFNLITRAGAFYTYEEEKVQGKDNLVTYLEEHPELRDKLAHAVEMEIKAMRMGKRPVPEVEESKSEDSDLDEIVDDINSSDDE